MSALAVPIVRCIPAWSVVALVAMTGCGSDVAGERSESSRDEAVRAAEGRVVRVVDGDTVRVRLDDGTETVRYIGVDTPETVKPGAPVECFGEQAGDANRRLVDGRRVRLRFDRERLDRYGRLLAYVYLAGADDTFVNAALVERGYARTLAITPNTRLAPTFERLERQARQRRSGLWGACP